MNREISPEVQFWGLVVPEGKPATVSLENEDGFMELFHLTNVALQDMKGSQPCQVKIRAPNDDREFVVGTLLPGNVLQFQTDMLLQPDTIFTHSGQGEVHLTGYKCITIEDEDDEDDDDDESEDDDDDEDDDDFIVDGKQVKIAGSSHDGVSDEDSDRDSDDEEDNAEAKRKTARSLRPTPVEDEDDEDSKDGVMKKAKQSKLLARAPSKSDHFARNDDEDLKDGAMRQEKQSKPVALASGKGRLQPASSDEDDDEDEDMDTDGEDEDSDDEGPETAIAKANQAAERFKQQKSEQRAGRMGAEEEDKFEQDGSDDAAEDEDDEDDGSEDDDEDDDEEEDDDDDDEDEDVPLNHGAANAKATTQKLDANGAKESAKGTPKPSAQKPAAGPAATETTKKRDANAAGTPRPTKKAKVDDKPKSAPPRSSDVKKDKDGHPMTPSVTAATKSYASEVRTFLKTQTNDEMKMSLLGVKIKRPANAVKIGELLKHYPHWFYRSGDKGQELLKLTKEGKS